MANDGQLYAKKEKEIFIGSDKSAIFAGKGYTYHMTDKFLAPQQHSGSAYGIKNENGMIWDNYIHPTLSKRNKVFITLQSWT